MIKIDFLESVKEIGVAGFLDIVFMAVLIYVVIVAFKRTRAAFVLTGIFILAGLYLLTRQFNLMMTATVFERFFTVILIVLVVIFQEELKRFFEEIAVWSLNRRLVRKKVSQLSRDEVGILVKTVTDLAKEKIGVLIVMKGKNRLDRYIDGEVALNGELSEALLKSIFDPNSIGHDGAVIIDGNRVTHFSCHLPLSKSLDKIRDRGTRHAAALGISEHSDALCLVVSEEKGTISITRNGNIEKVDDPGKLISLLDQFYEETNPLKRIKPWEELFKKNFREKIYALLLAVGLWFVLVHGAKATYKSFVVPVSSTDVPEGWKLSEIDPKEIEVTFRAPRAAFYFGTKERVRLYLDMRIQPGAQRVRVSADDFTFPKGLVLEEFEPHYVKVTLDKKIKQGEKKE